MSKNDFNRIPGILSDHIVVGERFVFVLPQLEKGLAQFVPGVPWISSLTGGVPVKLASFFIDPKPVQKIPVGAVCPGKMLYGPKETVSILVCHPESRGKNVQLSIKNGTRQVDTVTLGLDKHGCAVYRLFQPLEGNYTARLVNTDFQGSFTVARYQLVPLNAAYLQNPAMAGPNKMTCKVKLTSFDVPLNGNVNAELMQGGQRVSRFALNVIDGITEPVFELPPGEAELSINFLHQDKTASLPVRGGKQSERRPFTANPLGECLSVSTLPPGKELRGLYFQSQDKKRTPFILENIVTQKGVLKINHENIKFVRIDIVDPLRNKVESRVPDNVTNSASIVFDVPDPYGVVFIGAIIDGKAYEAYTTVVRPETQKIKLHVPDKIGPGDEAAIELEASEDTGVWVTVTDGRTVSHSTIRTAFAATLKKGMEKTVGPLKPGEPSNNQAKHIRPCFPRRTTGGTSRDLLSLLSDFTDEGPRKFYSSMNFSSRVTSQPMERSVMRKMHSGFSRAAGLSDTGPAVQRVPNPREETVVETTEKTPRQKMRKTVLERYFSLNGKKIIGFRAPETITQLRVTVQTVQNYEAKLIEKKIDVTKDLFVEFNTPPFVFHKDKVRGELNVHCQSGAFTLFLYRDGKRITLTDDRRIQIRDQVLNRDGTFTFDATPGRYRAVLKDLAGRNDEVETTITAPGQFVHKVKSTRILQPGEKIATGENGILAVQLLPSLLNPFKKALQVTAGYQHLCCEQTAAKLAAAAAMYLAGDDNDRTKAERTIVNGVRREETMYRKGGGFLMYPDGSHVSDYYSKLAAGYLLTTLKPLQAAASGPGLKNACNRGLEMAKDAARFHGLQFPPLTISSCRDAYYSLLENPDHGPALDYINTRITPDGRLTGQPTSGVHDRAETAYAAAALFLLGPGYLKQAIMASNRVTEKMAPNGAWYSTLDSMAGIAMMDAIRRTKVLTAAKNARAIVNGEKQLLNKLNFQKRVSSVQNPVDNRSLLPVQVETIRHEDWHAVKSNIKVDVNLTAAGSKIKTGDALDIEIRLPRGYSTGDLCFVCLPPALSFVWGGGQVKMMALDFEGRDRISVPIAALSPTKGKQHFAVCVRNMYDEEKIGNPGWQKITVDDQ